MDEKKEVLARAVAECDKDFRPVYRIEEWDRERAGHIINRLSDANFKIVKKENSSERRN